MKISPIATAVAAALIVIAAIVFVLHPAQLTVQPKPQPTIVRSAEPVPSGPLRLRPHPLVYVAGAVVHPGVYEVGDDARARDALAKAGGALRDADLVAVNLAARVADGDEIAVPHQGDARVPAIARSKRKRSAKAGGSHRRRRPRREAVADAGPASTQLDLNSADASALADLPGIGETLAERIVEFRTLNGPFVSLDGLADVAGITPARLDALEPLLRVEK